MIFIFCSSVAYLVYCFKHKNKTKRKRDMINKQQYGPWLDYLKITSPYLYIMGPSLFIKIQKLSTYENIKFAFINTTNPSVFITSPKINFFFDNIFVFSYFTKVYFILFPKCTSPFLSYFSLCFAATCFQLLNPSYCNHHLCLPSLGIIPIFKSKTPESPKTSSTKRSAFDRAMPNEADAKQKRTKYFYLLLPRPFSVSFSFTTNHSKTSVKN